MKVSVVIPTFNRAAQIRGALESVFSQTWKAFEVIVIDDGSSDTTEEVLASVMHKIRYIKTPNHGVSAARNRGILEAKGDWIAFLDSDDTWEPEKLERQAAAVNRFKAKVCLCASMDETKERLDDLQRMDPELELGGERFYPQGDCRLFMHSKHPFLQSMLVEKAALMQAGIFDESLKVAEDTKLIYGLVMGFGYCVVNEKLVNICRDRETPGLSDTVSLRNAFKQHQCYIRVQAEAYWRLIDVDAAAAAMVRNNQLYFMSRQAEIACALGMRDLARRYALSGLVFGGQWKSFVRSFLVYFLYPVASRVFLRKWSSNHGVN
jgi:glycosyltransferase involved in cell wall biosynthesis